MKFIYKGIGLISILFIVASCSFSKKQTMNKAEANDSCKIEVVVLDPGHFHASLLQKETLTDVSDTIRIYAPEGIAVNQYLESIDSYNQRAESPTTWKKQVYTGDDYLQKMLADGLCIISVCGTDEAQAIRRQQASVFPIMAESLIVLILLL